MDIYTQSPLLPLRAKKKKYWLKKVIFTLVIIISATCFFPTNKIISTVSTIAKKPNDLSYSTNIPIQLESTKTLSINVPELQNVKPNFSNADIPQWDVVKVQAGDSLTRIFSKLRLPHSKLHEILGIKSIEEYLSNIKPGQSIHFLINDECKNKVDTLCDLTEMKMPVSASTVLHITNEANNVSHKTIPLETRMAYAEGVVTESLYESANKADLTDKTILQLTHIFGWDIDFALDMRENDSFKVLYENRYLNDKKIGTGDIVAAEFSNQGQIYQAIRHIDNHGSVKYYTPEGLSLQKAFLRTPVNFTRISSRFSTGRHHPVLHKIRAHKGVDYAAPTGTPVKSSGDGKVIFRGQKGGYGNVVIIQHGPKYSTLYAHLSRFNRTVKNGSFVKQGQVIAYVGMTGLASGPHLHYEFRVNGTHRNPLTVTLPDAAPITKDIKPEFLANAKSMLNLMEAYRKIEIAKYDG